MPHLSRKALCCRMHVRVVVVVVVVVEVEEEGEEGRKEEKVMRKATGCRNKNKNPTTQCGEQKII